MRLRSFVMYFWSITMFIFAAFGTFYLITGQNIITGQSRNEVNVLPAHTENTDSNDSGDEDKKDEPKENNELVVFNEVMSKTNSDASFKLEPADESDTSVVYVRFGKDVDTYYVATYGSGLNTEEKYSVWLVNDEKEIKLGTLESVDDTDVLKLGFTTKDDITGYTGVVVATGDGESLEDLDQTHSADVEINLDSTGDAEDSSSEESTTDTSAEETTDTTN